ncbi:hypothetical protein M378DRAFT_170652 [Amanita muscaria Koide BX008]|uniref:Non-specific serine/threonine protein kinase n=1 Tax=Amanita muscaria (strain Koide BX008) TaxID=946122 RepID=A0A0C2WQ75_AMAMK|nr:hypothetical protein M378DRAFT_170652 [Amanita muscaria Koide BX008]
MSSLRVKFPYQHWPGWDIPELVLSSVQLPSIPSTNDTPPTLVATVDKQPITDYGSDSPVFRATIQTDQQQPPTTVALKFALRQDLIPSLAQEAYAYSGPLKSLQGKAIPICYGLYAGVHDDDDEQVTIACLVLEFWGQCIRQPFRRLSRDLKLKILTQLGQLHKCGLHHDDFAERNVLERNGDIRIIDFDLMVEHHDCHCVDFKLTASPPDVDQFGCPLMWQVCRYTMKIWDST